MGELELIAASTAVQEAWAKATLVPSEEIALQFYDSVPLWLQRLRESHLIEPHTESTLVELKAHLERHQTKLFDDGPFVRDSSEWKSARALASAALVDLKRAKDAQPVIDETE
jgi:hypothetical protein